MLYLVAFFCPPLAILLAGKPFQAMVNFPLMCLGWFPAVIHAFLVASLHYSERQNKALVGEMRQQTREMARQTQAMQEATRRATQQPARDRPVAPPMVVPGSPVVSPSAAFLTSEKRVPPQKTPPPLQLPLEPSPTLGERLTQAKVLAIQSYRNLPEWGQPIVWGMIAATPFVFGIMVWQVLT